MWRDYGYLVDILQAAHNIQAFTRDVDEERFISDELIQSAVIRQFEIIGEAAGRVATKFVLEHPEIPWREMASMRNRLIHEYTTIRMDVVWQSVRVDIPALIKILSSLDENEERA